MPRGRPRKYGPFLPGKGPAWSKKTTAGQLALKKVRKLEKEIEPKYFDTSQSTAVEITSASVGNQLNLPSNDVSGDGYVGNEYRMKWIQVNYQVELGSALTVTPVRILLTYDKLNGLGAPVFTDLNTTLAPYGFVTDLNLGKLVVLYDRIHFLNATDKAWTIGKIKVNLKDKLVKDNTYIGKLNLWAISEIASGAAANTKPLLTFASRLKFVD